MGAHWMGEWRRDSGKNWEVIKTHGGSEVPPRSRRWKENRESVEEELGFQVYLEEGGQRRGPNQILHRKSEVCAFWVAYGVMTVWVPRNIDITGGKGRKQSVLLSSKEERRRFRKKRKVFQRNIDAYVANVEVKWKKRGGWKFRKG